MRVAIVGSRQGVQSAAVERFVSVLGRKYPDSVVVSGGAQGVDSWAVETAHIVGLLTEVFPAEWEKYGRSAGYRRNVQIVDAADIVVAFTTGSPGTRHTIDIARAKGIPVYVFDADGLEVAQYNT